MDTNQLVDQHTARFGAGDLEGLLSEYHEDVVFLSPYGVLKGVAAMRPLFEAMIAEFSLPGVSFALLSRAVEGDYAYLSWKAETPRNSYAMGSDTMVFRDGKIILQTAAFHVTPKG